MITEDVMVQVVIVVGSVLTTYLTVKYKNKIIKPSEDKNQDGTPKTRMDVIFDGYEKLIKQQQEDILRKEKQLQQTQDLIDRLQEEVDETRQIVKEQQKQLEEQKQLNQQLKEQLALMKKNHGVKKDLEA